MKDHMAQLGPNAAKYISAKEDCGDGYTTVNIPKTPRCILQIHKLWYVNYILIKLLPKKQKIMPGDSGLLGGAQGHLGGHWEHSRYRHFGIRLQK